MRSTPERDAWLQERLRLAVETLAGGSADKFGRLLGYANGGYIREILDGKKPVRDAIIERANTVPASAGWFDLPGETKTQPPPAPPQDYADRHVVSESDWAALQELRDIEAAPPLARKLNELRADLAELKSFAKRFTQRIEATEVPAQSPGSTLAEGLAPSNRVHRPPGEAQLIGNIDQIDQSGKQPKTQQEKQHGRRRPNR